LKSLTKYLLFESIINEIYLYFKIDGISVSQYPI